MIKRVIKRDGRIVEFNNQKIVAAILKAMAVTSQGEDIILAAQIADKISKMGKDVPRRKSQISAAFPFVFCSFVFICFILKSNDSFVIIA